MAEAGAWVTVVLAMPRVAGAVVLLASTAAAAPEAKAALSSIGEPPFREGLILRVKGVSESGHHAFA
jgi:hypothetical protein